MTATPCPGDCNRAWRKAQQFDEERERLEQLRQERELTEDENLRLIKLSIEPVAGDPVWCPECLVEITRSVRRMPDLAAWLYGRGHHWTRPQADEPVDWVRVPVPTTDPARLHPWTNLPGVRPRRLQAVDRSGVPLQAIDEGKLSTVRAERSSSTKGSPSGSPAWDAVDELVSWAAGVEDKARARLGHEGRDGDWWSGRNEARRSYLSTSVLWILARLEVWALPEAERWGREALRLAKRAEKLSGRDELVHHLGRCPTCDRKALIRIDGEDVVHCQSCRRRWSEDEYQWLVRTAVAAAKEGAHHE